jgi:hypothetical protein
MNKVICASYPRTGHQLLVDMLSAYFGRRWKYCDHYNHCYQVPCTEPGVMYHKNHDLFLDGQPVGELLRNIPGYYYIVQFRHPVPCIISYWLLSKKEGWIPGKNKKEWLAFFEEKLKYWQAFMHKWIIDNPYQHMAINYDDLLRKPVPVVINVLKMMGELDVNVEKVKLIVEAENVCPKSNIKDFRYYDAQLFYDAEKRVAEEMHKLGIINKIF